MKNNYFSPLFALRLLAGLLFSGLPVLTMGQNHSASHLPERKKNSLSIQWGLHWLASQDQLLSPLVYKDKSAANVGIWYGRTGKKAKNTAGLQVDRYTPTAHPAYTYTQDGQSRKVFPTTTTVVTFRYGHARRLSSGALWGGLMSDNQVRASDQGYGSASVFNYLGSFSLSPWVVYERALSDRLHLTLQTWVPLVSWVARSPYALNDDQYMRDNASHQGAATFFNYVAGGGVQSLAHWQKLTLAAEVTYSLSSRIGVLVAYQAEALRYTKPRTLRTYQHQFNTGFGFNF